VMDSQSLNSSFMRVVCSDCPAEGTEGGKESATVVENTLTTANGKQRKEW
jgi:ribosomal protein S27E